MKHMIPILAMVTLVACSSVPDNLQVPDDKALVSYQAALENPEQVVGQPARWGGVIADVRNSDEGTVIEVVNFDLQSWGRPQPSDQSQGRFRAKFNGFVDPVVYKQGKEITFIGTIGQPESGTIDEYTYLFPVLNASNKHLWPVRKEPTRVEVNYDALWYRHYWYSYPNYPRPIYVPAPVMKDGGQAAKQ
ncbi:outer membrane lipoprotein [Pseudidiomarina indica]|uniref:Outer membrane lipoprotein n=1 Tax=Pseudidiomarina indica TaxID=1159017 RepID=A0A1G6C8A2_9GAMM|nr:Slp family lipoprotein [Pseudidiomarina indica]SDB29125.1 outer membrane lipoprotein [Pseudidiomarina indica]